jgi:hypothetical protein
VAPLRIYSSIIFIFQANGPQLRNFATYLSELVVNIAFNTTKHASLIKVKCGAGGAKTHNARKLREHLKFKSWNYSPLVLLMKLGGKECMASGGQAGNDRN